MAQKIWDEKVIPGTIAQSEPFRQYMLSKTRTVARRCQIGFYESTAYEVLWGRIAPFIVRVTKGLLTAHYPARDYSEDAFHVGYVRPDDPRLPPLLTGTQGQEVGRDTFFYSHGLTDTALTGVWYLLFYELHGFFVVHTKHGDVAQILKERLP